MARRLQTMLLLTAVVVLSAPPSVLGQKYRRPRREGQQYWKNMASQDLKEAMDVAMNQNWGVAKNVIMFVGDGMGITATTAARIYKGQQRFGRSGEEGYLRWEKFPNSAFIKTYLLDRQVADSAAAATAFFSGVKANYYTIGVDNRVQKNMCFASLDHKNQVSSVIDWAQKEGKHTGLVTTTRVTHATPAALYAHSANRDWECDTSLGLVGHGCKDIARQLAEDEPGRSINVIMGGGRHPMGSTYLPNTDPRSCGRADGRNLTLEWLLHKTARGYTAKYIHDLGGLLDLDIQNTDYVMGLFGDSHMDFEADRKNHAGGQPSLANMTSTAIRLLSKNRKGYFLMVEGGRIDHALHNSEPRRAMDDVLAFEDAVTTALNQVDTRDTLIIVTADHSHVMTINGYPVRGNNILGIADYSETDKLPYTTLMFTNGHGYDYRYDAAQGKVVRADVSTVNTTAYGYTPLAAVPMPEGGETHGGEDVAAFAIGPMSHLLHRTHEQNYLAHVVGMAACMGPHASTCTRPKPDLSHQILRR
ncbi:alkaline phosphatase-like isoform X2 [Oratosquilla oratoria]